MTTPIDLFASALQFHRDGDVRAAVRQLSATDSDAWQISAFHVETDEEVHADYWEMHPAAEEAVCCLTGGLRIYFRAVEPDGEEEMTPLVGGSAAIVPRGRWHRLQLDEPSDIMAVTLRRGTQLERREV